MADRPIIFSGPMVRALLDGRKTQTRRLVKVDWNAGANPDFTGWRAGRVAHRRWQVVGGMGVGATVETNYGPGDRLYVREAHALAPSSAYRMSEGVAQAIDPADRDRACIYREGWIRSYGGLRWRPSIHMPRWASRLTLIVTDVRVQRLQEISAQDTIEEGLQCESCEAMRQSACNRRGCFASSNAFRAHWNSLHGPEVWEANPWVEAITFTVHRCNIDQMQAQEAIPATAPSWPAAEAENTNLPAIDETTGGLIRREGDA